MKRISASPFLPTPLQRPQPLGGAVKAHSTAWHSQESAGFLERETDSFCGQSVDVGVHHQGIQQETGLQPILISNIVNDAYSRINTTHTTATLEMSLWAWFPAVYLLEVTFPSLPQTCKGSGIFLILQVRKQKLERSAPCQGQCLRGR